MCASRLKASHIHNDASRVTMESAGDISFATGDRRPRLRYTSPLSLAARAEPRATPESDAKGALMLPLRWMVMGPIPALLLIAAGCGAGGDSTGTGGAHSSGHGAGQTGAGGELFPTGASGPG